MEKPKCCARKQIIVTVAAALFFLLAPVSRAQTLPDPNVITFDDNATACGGSVLCMGGSTGYNGTTAFDLSTINSWFQIGTTAQPSTAGQFRVVNDTGSTVTSFSLTITNTFNASTPSVTFCTDGSGPLCDNFQAGKGAAAPSGSIAALSGQDFFSCTNGSAMAGFLCASTGGQAAANFTPNQVTYNWTGLNIAPGTPFDISFSSWNTTANADVVPEPPTWTSAILGVGLFGIGAWFRKKDRGSPAGADTT